MYRNLPFSAVRIRSLLAIAAGFCFAVAPGKSTEADNKWDDRMIAEWVLRLGGSVIAAGQPARFHDIAGCLRVNLRLRVVDLVTVVIKPEEIRRLANLTDLEELIFIRPYVAQSADHRFRRQLQSPKGFDQAEKACTELAGSDRNTSG